MSIIDHTNDTFIDPSEELINRIVDLVFLDSGLLDKPGQRIFRDYSTPWDMIVEYIAYLKLTGSSESKKFRTEPGYLKAKSDLEERRRFKMFVEAIDADVFGRFIEEVLDEVDCFVERVIDSYT
jgi:hypothetical protein